MMWMYCDGCIFCFFRQKTAYEVRISDWSSYVCSSDLPCDPVERVLALSDVGSEKPPGGISETCRRQKRGDCRRFVLTSAPVRGLGLIHPAPYTKSLPVTAITNRSFRPVAGQDFGQDCPAPIRRSVTETLADGILCSIRSVFLKSFGH